MKKLLFPLLYIVFAISSLSAQVITSEPAFPIDSDEITVYFDATKGNAGLEGYTEDVYVHIGVYTDLSPSTWKYVKTNWGENTTETKLTRISDDYYSITLSPNIRDYFGVPEGETITTICFVFRAHDNSKEGKDEGNKDIFLPLYEGGLSVSFITPDNTKILDRYDVLNISIVSSEEADLKLYRNDDLLKEVTGQSLTQSQIFPDPGDFWLKVSAETDTETDVDSVFIHVLDSETIEALANGMIDGVNYLDNTSATLVLYAPGKEHVFALGDFNNWTPSTDFRMKKYGDIYWITLNNLTAGEEYGYQYLIDGELYLADPYSEKILDPWNDKWIEEETYPNLKEYPSEYATGIVSVLECGQEDYVWDNTDFVSPDQNNLVIYELLLRDFIAAHDWTTLTDTLNYFTDLGITAIELMPFNEFEGNESWGYNPSFYFAPDKYYGPKEDLQVFIDSCHGRDIAVIMDMVLNHSYGLSPLVKLYYDESTYKVTDENPWYNVDSPNPDYSWGYDFDHENQATKDFVDRVTAYWMNEYKVDGYRFDFTKGFTNTTGGGWDYDGSRIAILKRMADEIWNVKDDAYVILEHFADNSEEKELANYGMMIWGNITGNYGDAAMAYNEDSKSDFNWISYANRGWNDANLVGYMESHDEERLMYKMSQYGNFAGTYLIKNEATALDRMELVGAFFLPIPGPKMIWQFGELGYDYSIDYNGRVGNKPIEWDYYNEANRKDIYDTWRALAYLKTTEPAFTSSDFSLNVNAAGKRIEINHTDMDVRIIGNFDVRNLSINPNFSKTGTWYEFFTGESLDVTNVNSEITLAAGEYRLYTTKFIQDPTVSIREYTNNNNLLKISVYPIPASNKITVSAETPIKSIAILDLKGRIIYSEQVFSNTSTLNTSMLSSGMYILQIESNNHQTSFEKFIKN